MSEPLHIRTTADGSHTVFFSQLNEHYHSTFGALTESMHVFIRAGFDCLSGYKAVTVFEVGFGTGLNALLTLIATAKNNCTTVYHTIEDHPLDEKLIHLLNYADLLPGRTTVEIFHKLHRAPWDSCVHIDKRFILHKIKADFLVFNPGFHYDIVYFDAFAPAKQPEMWRKDNFEKIYTMLNPGGILVTYCVQGEVKRNIKATGFQLETLPGPPGKREMLRAKKIEP
ncbi:MAG: tRNA (5-methylaminomethyl-2-thiouridine)(34)-methyltransferase MnmD [Bacteroidales bacterium]|nr:tRNA (5-methylaminomethyl-2-thiouridine)(34)-methyltransferase MnmD [Bacteroidales bacterium]